MTIFLTEAQLAAATPEERAAYKRYLIQKAMEGDDWASWLRAMFPQNIKSDFGDHHAKMWEWVWGIEAGRKPPPFIGIWNRGGAKSSTAEMAVAALGARGARKYVLYCCETQDQANEHVGSIATLLGTEEFAMAYPEMADRAVDKYGQARGWRRDRLSTASGFVIDGIGLSDSVRGLRSDDQRPDLIIIDDIDSGEDSPKTTAKKIDMLARKLLPTGAPDLAVLAIQNMVHSQSIFARLASTGKPGEVEPADFLTGIKEDGEIIPKVLSGPIPAVWDMTWEFINGIPTITGGRPSWVGLDLDACQDQIMEWGISSFLVEAQHEEEELRGGMFDSLDFEHMRKSEDQAEADSRGWKTTCCWMDPAVTESDRSDSCAVQIDSLGNDGKIYRRYSWEKVSGPDAAMKQAIIKAVEYGAEVLGVETDQGGLAWKSIFRSVMDQLEKEGKLQEIANESEFLRNKRYDDKGNVIFKLPRFEEEKAGASKLSKTDRAGRMLSDYERDKIRHIEGTHRTLERSLMRFPRFKPFDLVDAAYWSWYYLHKKATVRIKLRGSAGGHVGGPPVIGT